MDNATESKENCDMLEFQVQTSARDDMVDITALVSKAIGELDCEEGTVLVWVPHTTAAVTVNEGADPDVVRDIKFEMDKIVPWQDGYHHAEGNTAAHIKSSMFGCDQLIPVRDGRPVLGTWQTIWFCEFDGPRRRRVMVGRV
jgi:secondary thiamine-phosphate synthase enzyme